MSLVDYQSSSSDESDDENKPKIENIVPVKQPVVKKNKEPVKITVPAITEDDEDQNSSKKLKVKSSSGLLGLLPAPKYSTEGKKALVPHVLTKKAEPVHKISKNVMPTVSAQKPIPQHNIVVSEKDEEDNESENTTHCDFFSLQSSEKDRKSISLPPPKKDSYLDYSTPQSSEINNIKDNIVSKNIRSTNQFSVAAKYLKEPVIENSNYEDTEVNTATSSIQDTASVDESHDILNDEGFLRLQGKKRGCEEINIIDVNVNEEVSNSQKEWMKSLTEERASHSRKRTRMPTSVQKRKHQITYLAFQAKERELDLKNQWAHNRLTRRETQAKYGF